MSYGVQKKSFFDREIEKARKFSVVCLIVSVLLDRFFFGRNSIFFILICILNMM